MLGFRKFPTGAVHISDGIVYDNGRPLSGTIPSLICTSHGRDNTQMAWCHEALSIIKDGKDDGRGFSNNYRQGLSVPNSKEGKD